MIGEIKRRLENGERVELECIDRDGFVNWKYSAGNKRILNRESIIVRNVSDTGYIYLKGNGNQIEADCLLPKELKYFKIKEGKA